MFRRIMAWNIVWLIVVGVNGLLLLFLLNSLRASRAFVQPALDARKDPALGTELPDALRPFLDIQKPLLVVTFGQCSECTISKLNSWIVMLERWAEEIKGVVVVTEITEAVKDWQKEYRWQVPLVTDGKGEIIRKLNAYFLPRAYGFSPDGKLVWKQDRFVVSQLEAIRCVVEEVKGKEYAKQVFDRKPAWAEELEKGRRDARTKGHKDEGTQGSRTKGR